MAQVSWSSSFFRAWTWDLAAIVSSRVVAWIWAIGPQELPCKARAHSSHGTVLPVRTLSHGDHDRATEFTDGGGRRVEGGSSTGGAAHGDLSLLVLDHQSLQTPLAVDVEALEQFRVFEGVEADGTGQLVLQLLQSLGLGLGRHCFKQSSRMDMGRTLSGPQELSCKARVHSG